jgi:hypothetical protein
MSIHDSEFNSSSFFAVPKKDREAWLQRTIETLIEESQARTQNQRNNLMGYLGVETDTVRDITRREDRNYRNGRRASKFKINHLFDVVETKVSQMTRLKSNVEVKPTHPDWGDRGAAEVSKHVIRNIFDQQNFDAKAIDIVRQTEITGESYLFVEWDKDCGDLHPSYVEAKNAGLDSVPGPDGKPISLKKPIYLGDVKHTVEFPWRIFLQRKEKFEDCDYVFRIHIMERDKVESNFPKYEGKLAESSGITIWDVNMLEEQYMENHVAVYEFFHRRTKEMPNGYHAMFCDAGILMEQDLPYEHGKLPMVRLTDIDLPGYINGLAKFTSALQIQNRYDDLNTLILKNIYFLAHPKYAVPKNAVDIRQLGNDNTVVEWVGAPPTVLQAQANSSEVYKYGPEIIRSMERIMGNHGISRGEMPNGISAASALRLLNEMESIRATSAISKYAQFVKDVARLTLSTAGQYYLPSDGRLVKIVGEDNAASIRFFDAADLNKPYDVQFENSTGFPDTQAAQKQEIIDVLQYAGDAAPLGRLLDALDIANADNYNDYLTAAVKASDSENQDLQAGRPVAPPEMHQDLITKWESRFHLLQSRAFNEESTQEVYNAVMLNVKQVEELMIAKMAKSPIFQAEVARLVHFPLMDHSGYTPPQSRQQTEAIVQGEANRGEPVTDMIPAEPKKIGEK